MHISPQQLGEATMGAIAVIALLVCLAMPEQPAREGRAADVQQASVEN